MQQLIVSSLLFLGLHLLPSTPLRPAAIARHGPAVWNILFSLASAVALAWMILAYRAAGPAEPLWVTGEIWRWVTAGLMLPAFALAVAGVASPNPAMTMGESALARETPWGGIFAVTRHPLMWGIGLWGLLHVSNRPDAVSAIFFGSLALLAIVGSALQEHRKRRELGAAWHAFEAHTSFLPLAAILTGRATFSLRGIGWWRLALAVLIWAAALHLHGTVFGIAPVNF